ncbi:transcriptional regulator [Kitasatospora indigofera]|uniref:Transcriptional regulator n=1 Tax=Kitasatospora indigofera TaxID=67307 RepID=A0A919KLB1_9ACTN|nr:helix-turn-helix transcriptional regulator [Kitasatospora indigofera]GHH64084.1 transcriptional regulator [Kitasatospora indigofera]
MVNRKVLDPTSSPWAPFGVQLRRSREALGLTQAQLAKQLGYDHTSVCYIELAKRAPTAKFARLADEALQTGGTLVLMWWQHKHTALIEGFPEFAEHEARATQLRLFEIGVVPGLLQTQAYATAWEAGNVRRGSATPAQADERVAFLLTRQQCLDRTQPPTVHAVLDESCLLRPIGGRDVMVSQLDHLEDLATRSHVILQVAPYSLGEDRPFTHPVALLTLPDRKLLAYTETEQRGYLDRDTESVSVLNRHYDRLQVEALNRAATLATIRRVREDFEHAR